VLSNQNQCKTFWPDKTLFRHHTPLSGPKILFVSDTALGHIYTAHNYEFLNNCKGTRCLLIIAQNVLNNKTFLTMRQTFLV